MSLSPISHGGLGDPSSREIGRYTLLFRFAAGGMAEVFVGRMRGEGGFEKPVAIKRMLPALAEETRFVDMFLDEARIAAMVSSPHVVPTLDVGKDEDGLPYIVMELVTGVSLSQLMRAVLEKQQPYPPLPMIVEILAQAAQGLDDAHTARRPTGEPLELIHRDVSPQNILVGVDGRARLTDFGVARAIQRVTRTSTGEVKGKLSYFSPEQAQNAELDQRSDVFALGVVAWEMISGRRLFQRDDPMSTLRAVLQEPIPLVSDVRPEVPQALANTIALALVRDRDQRFESAGAFAHALRTSGVPTPTRASLGKWIESVGGEKLQHFQSKIARAFGAPAVPDARTPLPLATASPDSPVEVRIEPPSNSAVRTVLRQPEPVPPEPPTQARAHPTAASPSSGRGLWIGIGVVVALLVAAAVGLALAGNGAPEVVASPLAPVPTSTPVLAPAAAAPPTELTTGTAAPPDEAPLAATGTGAARRSPVRREGTGASAAAPSVDATAVAPALAAPAAPTTTTPTAPTTTTPTAPEPVVRAAEPEPPPAARPATHEAADPTPPPATETRRRRLMGLDQFERETSSP